MKIIASPRYYEGSYNSELLIMENVNAESGLEAVVRLNDTQVEDCKYYFTLVKDTYELYSKP